MSLRVFGARVFALSPRDVRAINRAAELIEAEADAIRRSSAYPDGTFPEPGDRIDYEDRMRSVRELLSIVRRLGP